MDRKSALSPFPRQYIQGLPIVPPTRELANKVTKVLKLAKSEGSDSATVREIEADINEIVFGLYGLTRDEIRLVKEDLATSQQQDPKQIRKSEEYKDYIKATFAER